MKRKSIFSGPNIKTIGGDPELTMKVVAGLYIRKTPYERFLASMEKFFKSLLDG